MSKSLDKMLKNELVAMVQQLQAGNQTLASQNAQLLGDKDRMREDIANLTSCVEDLESKLAALEERRRFESIAYRKKIRTQRAVSPGSVRGLGEAAKRYCEEHGVASCTPEQARTMLSS